MLENTDSVAFRLQMAELCYGKQVQSPDGPVIANAEYGVTATSHSVKNSAMLLPANLVGDNALRAASVDPAFEARGALVVRAVGGGIAAMRVRFRPEAGENAGGRKFYLSTTIFLPNLRFWHEVPPGFFSWCEAELEAEPRHLGPDSRIEDRLAVLPNWPELDEQWINALPQWRMRQLGAAFDAIDKGVTCLAAHPPVEIKEERPGALLARDLDNIAWLMRGERPAKLDRWGGFLFNCGLDLSFTTGAICYLSTRQGRLPENSHMGDRFRRAVSTPARANRQTSLDLPSSQLVDNMGRRIGRDPIPFKRQVVTAAVA